MHTRLHLQVATALLSLSILILPPATTLAQGTAFTFQGLLNSSGAVAHGSFDLRFALYDAASNGVQQGATLTNTATAVSNGYFTVTLDFGNQFPGANRWLEIAVRTNGGGAFGTLSPRQPLTSTPYAVRAANFSGAVTGSQLAGTYGNALTFNNAANSFSGNGGGLTNLNASQLASGTVPDARLAVNVARTNQVWLLGGNTGTTPSTHFLGTTDNQAVEVRVNGTRALRLEPGVAGIGSPNVVGGSPRNFVNANIFGSFIGGGGTTNEGGTAYTNSISAIYGVVGGGKANAIEGFAHYSFIGGGNNNNIKFANPGAISAVIGGGEGNAINGGASFASIGGGQGNVVSPSATHATIPGGGQNRVAGAYGLAAGRRANANHVGAFVWADSQNADFTSSSSNQFLIRASGGVGIGVTNPGSALQVNGTITATQFAGNGAGLTNVIAQGLDPASVTNLWKLNGNAGTNPTNHFLGTTDNQPLELRANDHRVLRLEPASAYFGAGSLELAYNNAPNIVAGAAVNKVDAGVVGATIGGGGAGGYWTSFTASVPISNYISQYFGTISGGGDNKIIGSSFPIERFAKVGSTIGGGMGNVSSGNSATVPGGKFNEASGDFSFAAGHRAKATNEGAFVWADAQDANFSSTSSNQFLIRASGGVAINMNNPGGASLSVNGGIRARGGSPGAFGNNNNGYAFSGNGGDADSGMFSSADGQIEFFSNDQERMRIDADGKVGIGRVATANRLEVEGDASKSVAGSWLANSDARIKQDVQPVAGALDRLARVQLVSFRYTEDYRAQHPAVEDRRYLNVLAQQFRDVFPEHVKPSGERLADGSEILQVDTYPLTIYSAAAVQELNQKLAQKETELTELKQTVNELKQLMQAMNHKLNGGAK